MFNANFAQRMQDRMFKRADGVVWDMMTGKCGISTASGTAVIAGDGDQTYIAVNAMDGMSMEVPAFAQSTPVANVKVGDLIYFGTNGDKPGWIVERIEKPITAAAAKKAAANQLPEPAPVVRFKLMRTDGTTTTWTPPAISFIGMGDAADGVMVIRSLGNMLSGGTNALGGMQNSLMQMAQMQMMMGGEMDLESIMPMLLMSNMSGGQGGDMMGGMMQMMMMQSMMGKGGDNPMSKLFAGKSKTASDPFRKG